MHYKVNYTSNALKYFSNVLYIQRLYYLKCYSDFFDFFIVVLVDGCVLVNFIKIKVNI